MRTALAADEPEPDRPRWTPLGDMMVRYHGGGWLAAGIAITGNATGVAEPVLVRAPATVAGVSWWRLTGT